MKSLTQRKKSELFEVFEQFSIPLPGDDPTRTELLAALSEAGITNARLKAFSEKDELPKVEDDNYESDVLTDPSSGEVVVCMDRSNAFYQFGKYKFSQKDKFLPMSKQDADALIGSTSGFHKATREEIISYYR